MILLDLGRVEKELGHNKKANDLLKSGLLIHKEKYSKDRSRNLDYLKILGNYYNSLGLYKEAEAIFLKAEVVYNEKLRKDDPWKISYILFQLGDIYKNLRNFPVALSYFNKTLTICEKYYGQAHLKTAQALLELGQVYFLKGNLDSAEKFIQRALNIFEQSRHPQVYKCLENLSEIYQHKCNQAKAQGLGLAVEIENFNKDSINYLKQALDIAKAHFPEDSSHINRIQSKLRTLEQR
jgi:tetratricopeptide (TPR) repeat protein